MARYRPVDPRVDLPGLEERILAFWRDRDVFARSLELRRGAPEWVFYEGPPTANAKPHVGNVETRVFKDVYPRYKTMTGHSVPRKAGWDCHGLPVEIEVEKEIGTRTKRDIEAFGIAEFNRRCRESVKRYVAEWNRVTERIGFWLDLDDAYWTMDASYMQSVWWALKRLHEQGLLFQDDKVTAYCPRCGTPLSDHEVAMGYATVSDPSVFVRFPLTGSDRFEGASLLVWTTTPWTLLSNLGVAVDRLAPYVVAELAGERLILAEALAQKVLGEEATVLETFTGAELEGLRYVPPFDNVDAGHEIVAAEFVTMEDGTGLVHMAPAFGADDLEIGRRESWPTFNPVDGEGKFTDLAPLPSVRGVFVKDADPAIVEDLAARGLLFRGERYEHTYPLCWRCDTPLLYYARPAWYVRTTAVKDRLLQVNEQVNWYPEHIKHGRYGDWLANNVDWSLSRERYWGTPLPIWICEQGHETAVGGLDELSTLAGRDLTGMDPHRPFIDEVTFGCPHCGSEATRVPYLIDVWFDAGAMPYAQWHYRGPGSEGDELFRRRFPADFISEAIDQTRGWFYTLMAEAVLLFDDTAYRNVVCLGHILDDEGRKMSKRLGNVLDPVEIIDRYGADALRWFMIASGSPWAARRMSMESVGEVVRQFLLTLWNTYAFFVTYANLDEPDLAAAPPATKRPILDRWALSQLHGTALHVREAMEAYDATAACRRIAQFVDDLSNWYVRRSRRRFWDPARSGAAGPAQDKLAAYATLHECLTTVAGLVAPLIPFLAEELHANLVAEQDPGAPISVHLTDFPTGEPGLVDRALDHAMATARQIVTLGRQVRTESKVRVRQPLALAVVHVPGDRARLEPLLDLIAEELNVAGLRFAESAEAISGWRAKPNFRTLGPVLGPRVQEVAAALTADDGSLARELAAGSPVTVQLPSGHLALRPEDVELAQEVRSGWGVASDGAVTVALDLELTDELRRQGLAREVVRAVQDLRKSAGLEVSDRIVLGVEAEQGMLVDLADLLSWVGGEVLATDVRTGALEGAEGSAELTVDGRAIGVTLRRTGPA